MYGNNMRRYRYGGDENSIHILRRKLRDSRRYSPCDPIDTGFTLHEFGNITIEETRIC
jgi:hypothetical protein